MCLNESFGKGILPHSLRQSVVCCLPKGQKERYLLKNWRPISLLSVPYKLATGALGNRLKTVLPKLISSTQTGFIKGRFIGESTRVALDYDIMKYTEYKNMDGLIMLIDFEKAFDSVSWNFLYGVLRRYKFNENFINWITLFNTGITGTILQAGVLSEPFPIKRGCKQGDPIAPYLFLLCAQILCEMVLNNKNIRGITIGEEEFKLTQFADDTTIFMDGTTGSLQHLLNTLEIFGSLSGLKINKTKTKMIWIGKKRLSRIKLKSDSQLDWGTNEFKLLGLEFNVNIENMPVMNYSKALLKVDETIAAWKKRHLTPIGKITVIKSLILSQLNHLFMTIPMPNTGFCKDLNKRLFNFLGDGKPDKVKRAIITKDKYNGGLKMPDLKNFILSLKLTWIKRLSKAHDRPWGKLFQKTYGAIHNIYNFGPNWGLVINRNLPNKFWEEVFSAWNETYNQITEKSKTDVLATPLWYNDKLGLGKIYEKSWFNKGIFIIGDIVDDNMKILDREILEQKFGFRIRNFLLYFRIRSEISKYLQKIREIIYPDEPFLRPFIPHHIRLIITRCI